MLTVRNAEVRTATVEINTLTLSGKQVTLAVYRQLRERPLISDEDGITLNGEPWGVVEYHPDSKLCPDGDHIHIVWSAGVNLFRDTVVTSVPDLKTYSNPRHSSAYARAFLRDLLTNPPAPDDDDVTVPTLTVDGVQVRVHHDDACTSAITEWETLRGVLHRAAEQRLDPADWPGIVTDVYLPSRTRRRPDRLSVSLSAAVRYHQYRLDEAIAALGDEPVDRACLRLAAAVEKEVGHRRCVQRLVRGLAELPQLFIAA